MVREDWRLRIEVSLAQARNHLPHLPLLLLLHGRLRTTISQTNLPDSGSAYPGKQKGRVLRDAAPETISVLSDAKES
jgi:hypothetical protein